MTYLDGLLARCSATCAIDGCSNPGTVHVSGFPDCVDLCPRCDFICRNREDAFSESMREQGCKHMQAGRAHPARYAPDRTEQR